MDKRQNCLFHTTVPIDQIIKQNIDTNQLDAEHLSREPQIILSDPSFYS